MDYDSLNTDINFPHRSAFFLFCADFRPKVKGENPGLSIGDTAKKLGEMWNSSSAEDKQPYEKKAAKLKEKYDKVSRGRAVVGGFIFANMTIVLLLFSGSVFFVLKHFKAQVSLSQ